MTGGELPSLDIGGKGPFINVVQFGCWQVRGSGKSFPA